ncbi:MAG: EAL domain-containing protein, partial [Acidocella sp.]|nr:EAL domain-containing protein [Acidocella sp.]
EPDFVIRLQELLNIHGLPPAHLELEFSATGSFSNIETARQRLRELRELGVSIAIDDFGIGANGFSSLEYIPANIVKIDRHLVNTILNNPRQQVLVKSMLNMARELGMSAVAEGVENADTLTLLSRWSCDYAEGYLFNRPLAADAFIQWYRERYG